MNLSFEQKTFIVVGVLLAIAAIPLIRNMITTAQSKREKSGSVHDEEPQFTESGTEIVAGSPLLRRIRYQDRTPARTGQAAESYRVNQQKAAVELYQQNCTNPYDNELISWTKKLPGDRKKLDLVNVLPDLSDEAASALIRIFATEGGEAELTQGIAIRPALNDAAFKSDMRIFYTDMLRMLESVYAPQQIALWQRMLDSLEKETNPQ